MLNTQIENVFFGNNAVISACNGKCMDKMSYQIVALNFVNKNEYPCNYTDVPQILSVAWNNFRHAALITQSVLTHT